MNNHKCCSCRDGGVDSGEELTKLATVRNPDNGKLEVRGYLCDDHLSMYFDDGYTVKLG